MKAIINTLANLWATEPIMVVGTLNAIISLGVAFGLHLSANQIGSIVAAATAVLAVVARSQVTPTNPDGQK